MTESWSKEIFGLIFEFTPVVYIPLLYRIHVQFTHFKPSPEQMVELVQLLLKGHQSWTFSTWPSRDKYCLLDDFGSIVKVFHEQFPKLFQLWVSDPLYARCGGILLTQSTKRSKILEDPKVIKDGFLQYGKKNPIHKDAISLLCCHPCLTFVEHENLFRNEVNQDSLSSKISFLLNQIQLNLRPEFAAKIIKSVTSKYDPKLLTCLVEDKRFHPVSMGVNTKGLCDYIQCLEIAKKSDQIDALLEHPEIELETDFVKEFSKVKNISDNTLYLVLTHPKVKLYKGFCADLCKRNISKVFRAMFWSTEGPCRRDPSLFQNEALVYAFENELYLECYKLLKDEQVDPRVPSGNEFLHLATTKAWPHVRNLLEVRLDDVRARKKVKANMS